MSKEYYCASCGHTEQVEQTMRNGEVRYWQYHDCSNCGEKYGMVIVPEFNGQAICKCGGKDSLSVWEEILHRPKG